MMRWWLWVPAAAAMLCAPCEARASDWKEIKGDHFVVYYAADEIFAKDTLRHAETYYTRIADDLGYNRFSYWNWDNRVKIFIYPDEATFHKATGQPEWSKGLADYTAKEISTFNWNKEFQETLLPHEIGHLIFRDFVGFKGQVPLWLDEGVAQWQEPQRRPIARQAGYTVMLKRGVYPFEQFTSISSLDDRSKTDVHHFYMQALSVVDFLIKQHGTVLFTQFCRQLRDGKSLNDALKSAYAQAIPNQSALEEKWLKYVSPPGS